jgi:ABC-type amino acid transport substrate-binding protein
VVVCAFFTTGMAQTSAPEATPPAILKVATKPTPPFAMKAPDGDWHGIAIDLMTEIARTLGMTIAWTEVETNADLLEVAKQGRVDAAIAAITVTADREKAVDFSHSYYGSGLAIAIQRHHGPSFWAGIKALTSPGFLGTIGMLVALLLGVGALMWLIEKQGNAEQFERHPAKGIGSGFWWAAVTMTTVGYGDKTPVSPLGRFIAVIWMFAALILIAVVTAQLTSSLTVNRLTGPVTSIRDLSHSRIGVVEHTASGSYFDARSITAVQFPTVSTGLQALEVGLIDAFVHDEPILRYDVYRNYAGKLELLPEVFEPQGYAIALSPGSKWREPINQALLGVLASPGWSAIKAKYFGRPENDI